MKIIGKLNRRIQPDVNRNASFSDSSGVKLLSWMLGYTLSNIHITVKTTNLWHIFTFIINYLCASHV